MVKIVTLSASYTLGANESNNFNYTSGSIPTGYTFCGAFPLTTGNIKVIVRYANTINVGLINLNNSSLSGTVTLSALCIKSHLIS